MLCPTINFSKHNLKSIIAKRTFAQSSVWHVLLDEQSKAGKDFPKQCVGPPGHLPCLRSVRRWYDWRDVSQPETVQCK